MQKPALAGVSCIVKLEGNCGYEVRKPGTSSSSARVSSSNFSDSTTNSVITAPGSSCSRSASSSCSAGYSRSGSVHCSPFSPPARSLYKNMYYGGHVSRSTYPNSGNSSSEYRFRNFHRYNNDRMYNNGKLSDQAWHLLQ